MILVSGMFYWFIRVSAYSLVFSCIQCNKICGLVECKGVRERVAQSRVWSGSVFREPQFDAACRAVRFATDLRAITCTDTRIITIARHCRHKYFATTIATNEILYSIKCSHLIITIFPGDKKIKISFIFLASISDSKK